MPAIATVRADTIATTISASCTQCTERVWGHIAVQAAISANGSANTECSIITSRRNARTLLGSGAVTRRWRTRP